jgi:hypothetical protein
MLKSAILALSIGATPVVVTPPLAFISIDCTQYGSVSSPYIIISSEGRFTLGPLIDLDKNKKAVEFFEEVLAKPHEKYIDPACGIEFSNNTKDNPTPKGKMF